MEDNVPIGMKRKAGKMTAEEKRAADVNALQLIIFLIKSFLKGNFMYIQATRKRLARQKETPEQSTARRMSNVSRNIQKQIYSNISNIL